MRRPLAKFLAFGTVFYHSLLVFGTRTALVGGCRVSFCALSVVSSEVSSALLVLGSNEVPACFILHMFLIEVGQLEQGKHN
jgi:hypothetical protein